jgi:ABC-type transport system involved in multi-copper enzyme maturation permease subunit
MRLSLARGTTRIEYLCSKFLTLIIIALGFILAATIFAFIASVITTWLVTGGISWDFLTADFIGSILLLVGLLLFILFVWICFTVLLTVLFRSSTVGIITSFLFLDIEGYVIMSITTDNSPAWAAYTIGYNTQYILAYVAPGTSDYLLEQNLTTCGQSVLVLSVYCILFILAAFYIFRRQDLAAE